MVGGTFTGRARSLRLAGSFLASGVTGRDKKSREFRDAWVIGVEVLFDGGCYGHAPRSKKLPSRGAWCISATQNNRSLMKHALFVQKELEIMGSHNALPSDSHQVIQMLEQKLFPVEEAVGAIAPLEGTPALLRAWTENPSRFSKTMISMH